MEKYSQLQNSVDNAYTFMGAHKTDDGYSFSVYAPNATKVLIMGTFNDWKEQKMTLSDGGVWTLKTKCQPFDEYKFVVYNKRKKFYKADPYAFFSQTHGATNSVIYESQFVWSDQKYIDSRTDRYNRPLNVYEVHLGSWQNRGRGKRATYLSLAKKLVPYVKKMGYNYVEFMPITEHPLYDSWGYQVTGYFSPTARYGTPDELKFLINAFHKAGIGVILDWVPAHFCKDEHGLIEFDGSCLYESSDPFKKEHSEWGTRIFDTEKPAVKSFLLSSANYWLTEYHFDGIRVDAVASMLYLDYGRKDGQWQKNKYGGKEKLESVEFFRELSTSVFKNHPHVLLIAEESTAFPAITTPADKGGLGFNFKWNMGWMNDTLSYFSTPFNNRAPNYNKLTFPSVYAYTENYMLPLSHDEVVHGKYSLIEKQPGSYEQKFNGLKVLTAYQYAFVGKKLTFMGNEFAQFIEWNFNAQLDWLLLDYPAHKEYCDYVKKINEIYMKNSALWERDTNCQGFEWLKADDTSGIIAFLRKSDAQTMLCIFNTSPKGRAKYKLNIPYGKWKCILSTPDEKSAIIADGETTMSLEALSAYYFVKED